jgi:hypothetical protein
MRSHGLTFSVACCALVLAAGCNTSAYVDNAADASTVSGAEEEFSGLVLITEDEDGAIEKRAESSPRADLGRDEKELRRVPDVVGLTSKEAKKVASETGSWKVYKVRGKTGGYDTGKCLIASQSPQAGQMLECGGKILVTFPSAPMLSVPDIVGMTENDARSVVSKAKFNTRYIKKSDRKIVAQTPAAGEEASQGSAVKVVLE